MRISIIVPVFNIEKHLEKCVESILAQRSAEYEVLLVDDGSEDRSSEICDGYAAGYRNVRVIHKENGGLISARTAGLSLATGEYIMFVDGDDWLEKDCLAGVASILDKAGPDLICFGSKFIYPDRTECQQYPYSGLYGRDRIVRELFPILIEDSFGHYLHSAIWGKVFRKALLSEVYRVVDRGIGMGEDGVVTRPYIYRCSSIYFMRDCLYCYNRTNTSSMTIALKPIPWDNTLRIRNSLLRAFSEDARWLVQINRNTCHNILITAISRSAPGAPFPSAVRDIRLHWAADYIQEAARNCRYQSLTRKLSCFMVRSRLVFPLMIYAKLRRVFEAVSHDSPFAFRVGQKRKGAFKNEEAEQ